MFSLWRIRAKSVLKLKLKIKGIYGSFKKLTLIHFYYAKKYGIYFVPKIRVIRFPKLWPSDTRCPGKGKGAKARGKWKPGGLRRGPGG